MQLLPWRDSLAAQRVNELTPNYGSKTSSRLTGEEGNADQQFLIRI